MLSFFGSQENQHCTFVTPELLQRSLLWSAFLSIGQVPPLVTIDLTVFSHQNHICKVIFHLLQFFEEMFQDLNPSFVKCPLKPPILTAANLWLILVLNEQAFAPFKICSYIFMCVSWTNWAVSDVDIVSFNQQPSSVTMFVLLSLILQTSSSTSSHPFSKWFIDQYTPDLHAFIVFIIFLQRFSDFTIFPQKSHHIFDIHFCLSFTRIHFLFSIRDSGQMSVLPSPVSDSYLILYRCTL